MCFRGATLGGARQALGQRHGGRKRAYHHSSPHACQRPRVKPGPLPDPVTQLRAGRRARGAVKPPGDVAAGAGGGVLPVKLFSVRSCEVRASRGARGRLASLALGVAAGRRRRVQTSAWPAADASCRCWSARDPRAAAGSRAGAAFSLGPSVFGGRQPRRRAPLQGEAVTVLGPAAGPQVDRARRGARRGQTRAPGVCREGWPACDGGRSALPWGELSRESGGPEGWRTRHADNTSTDTCA